MFSSMLSLLGSLRRGNFVTNSLRFRSSASANLSRTPSVAGNRQVWTWSAWVKRGTLGEYALFGATSDASNRTFIRFNSSDQLDFRRLDGGASTGNVTTAVFRDCSAWYHVVISVDFSQASATSRAIIYVNGVQQTLGTSNVASGFAIVNLNTAHRVGYNESSFYFDGYLAEVNFIDGQALTPASFGAFDPFTNVWEPIRYTGTYGANGFYLKFANTSSVATLGDDSSGNAIPNNWTVNNVSLTAGATYDSMIDVPVSYADGGNGRGNYAVLNPVNAGMASTIVNGNLTFQGIANTNQGYVASTIGVNSGAFYFELTPSSFTGVLEIAIRSELGVVVAGYRSDGTKDSDNTNSAYGASWTASDIIGCAFNATTKVAAFYKNNVFQGSFSYTTSGDLYPAITVRGTGSANGYINFGQRPFNTAGGLPPAGFLALNTNNLPTPAIVNGANFMAATTYTGNASARTIANTTNGVSFQPNLVWIKSRTPAASNNVLFDSTRAAINYISSNLPNAQQTNNQSLTAFGTTGFSLGTDITLVNANGNSYVAWQWKAGDSSVSNTAGSITSQVNANLLSGFSIVTYTGSGATATVGHGLGIAPALILLKRYSVGSTTDWQVRHTSIAAANSIQLNSTNAAAAATTVWASTAPTSSVFSIGTSADVNTSGINYVAYCFAEIAGFSRFGSYTGNGSADGPFVFCGFRPRWIMIKQSTPNAGNWLIHDTARSVTNVMTSGLFADAANTESTQAAIDITANGFKLREAGGQNANNINSTYIFAAFAEVPSKYALAR